MKIVFFGTPEFSVPFFQALLDDSEMSIVAVITQPDKPTGRGALLKPSAMKMEAQNHSLPIFTPASLKTDKTIEKQLKELNADFFVVVAYGKLIPKSILEIPRLGVVNVHPSHLPAHRGPSPMQSAIAQGDASTGVTIMLLDEGMDTGPILAYENIELGEAENYTTLSQKVQKIGSRLLIQTLKRYFHQKIVLLKQDESQASITRLLSREDGQVNWNESVIVIERKSRAYCEWPGIWSYWLKTSDKKVRIKFLQIRISDFTPEKSPGTVLKKNARLFVSAINGTLEILELQLEGKQPMKAEEFLRGYPDIEGLMLE